MGGILAAEEHMKKKSVFNNGKAVIEKVGVILRNLRDLHERNTTSSPGCCGTGADWSSYTEELSGHVSIDQLG